ncbi:hypothetical protein CNMCM5793_004456 [Aspergillus hiratsukae]|uniref:Uncharacterized protein n=1 Tax=Aspergillus hiratsukae TaxID=1194566 RepID=A0A8H6PFW0_9EURO|nr:hypothetical protein CNMCM5793_004456 [Aspergillus hiratsukae]
MFPHLILQPTLPQRRQHLLHFGLPIQMHRVHTTALPSISPCGNPDSFRGHALGITRGGRESYTGSKEGLPLTNLLGGDIQKRTNDLEQTLDDRHPDALGASRELQPGKVVGNDGALLAAGEDGHDPAQRRGGTDEREEVHGEADAGVVRQCSEVMQVFHGPYT